MKKRFKSVIAITLCFIMFFGSFASSGEGIADLLNAFSVKASATFSPRTTAPSMTGYYETGGSTNPYTILKGNCVWYAYGRAYEMLGTAPSINTSGNAYTWYINNASSNAYPYGSSPRVGAIACWDSWATDEYGNKFRAGHVAIVEEIYSDGTMLISESAWNNFYFDTHIINSSGLYLSNGTFQNWNGTFQGFIYLPVETYTTAPSKPNYNIDKIKLSIGEKALLTWSNQLDATYYYCEIWKNGVQIYSEPAVNCSQEIAFSEPGNYVVYLDAFNPIGGTASDPIYITVYNSKPQQPNVTVSGTKLATFETAVLTWNDCPDATYYYCEIWKGDEQIYSEPAVNYRQEISFSTSGIYDVYLDSFNAYGGTIGQQITVNVYDSRPQKPEFRIDKQDLIIGEKAVVSWNDYPDATKYSLEVWQDGKQISTEFVYTSPQDIIFDNPGIYDVYIGSFNSLGSTASDPIEVTVKELHEHTYTSSETKPATCVDEGILTYSCSCGDSYTEVISATDHTPTEAVIENEVPATEISGGSYDEVVYCSECGEEISREFIETAMLDCDFYGASVDKTELVRGETVTWTILTSTDVSWLQLKGSYTTAAGDTKTLVTYYKASNRTSGSNSVTITDNDGVRIWVITMPLSYTASDATITETWNILYKVSGSTEWKYAEVKNEKLVQTITVVKNADVLKPAPSESYDKYTLVSATADKTEAAVGETVTYTIVVTSDITKVRIGYNYTVDGVAKTKTGTYQTTSTNVKSIVDNGDGTSTWTITYKVPTTAAGVSSFNVQSRGDAWGEAKTVAVNVK